MPLLPTDVAFDIPQLKDWTSIEPVAFSPWTPSSQRVQPGMEVAMEVGEIVFAVVLVDCANAVEAPKRAATTPAESRRNDVRCFIEEKKER